MHRYKIFLKSGEVVEVEAESVKIIISFEHSIRYDFIKSSIPKDSIKLMATFYSDAIYGWVELTESEDSKTGHWIMHQDHRECSRCSVYLLKNMPRNSYCPNCGARMQESEDKK